MPRSPNHCWSGGHTCLDGTVVCVHRVRKTGKGKSKGEDSSSQRPTTSLRHITTPWAMKPYKKPRAQLCVEPCSILSNAQPASFPRPGHWACRAHTHREDHLQVIEHLNLLWESLAAPSHQIVLTVGGRVTVCYRWGIHSKTGRSIIYIVSTVVATGDRGMFERAFPLKDKLCWETDIKWGTNYEHMCIHAHLSSPTAKNILAQLPSIFAEQLHTLGRGYWQSQRWERRGF